jgi:hypothetical protein
MDQFSLISDFSISTKNVLLEDGFVSYTFEFKMKRQSCEVCYAML